VNSPFSIPIRYAKCNPDLAQYSNTPSLRVAGFEDEEEHENEALVRHGPSGTNGSALIVVFAHAMGHSKVPIFAPAIRPFGSLAPPF
jgi:hypothetical protein